MKSARVTLKPTDYVPTQVEVLRARLELALTMLLERGMEPREFDARDPYRGHR